MKSFIKYLFENTYYGYFMILPVFKTYNYLRFSLLSDKTIIERRFKKAFGRKIDFNNPQTLNEKINWLKLNDRRDLHTQCADKIEVRKYVEKKIGPQYLIPLHFQTEHVSKIIPENIPDFPVIIKTNHDSGGGIIIFNKNHCNWKKIRLQLLRRLNTSYYQKSKEWQYKNIKRKILVESLLTTDDGKIPDDYKFHCLNGKVRMIQLDKNRGTDKHTRNWYDSQWQREPYKWSSPKANGIFTDPSNADFAKPKNFEKLKELSEALASDFDYVRVDWYDMGAKIFFGEMTFHHDSGTKKIIPEVWDYKLGEELRLSKCFQ